MAFLVALLCAIFFLDSPWNLVAVVAGGAVEVGEAVLWIKLSRRWRPRVGAEALIGKPGIVVVPLRPEGQVKVDGELWRARAPDEVGEGEQVRVRALDGLTLLVEPER